MSPAASTASWSSMQARIITPRSKRSAWNEEELETSFNSSRYRVLDASQKQQEMEHVERIVSDLEAQRRCRSTSSRSNSSSRRQEAEVVPIRSRSPCTRGNSSRFQSSRYKSSRFSFEDESGEGDESVPPDGMNSTGGGISQSFQDQVLEELRKLKEAQQSEFQALERLQREKEEAERKAQRLEQKLREQQRQFSRSENIPTRKFDQGSWKSKSQPHVVLHEDLGEENDRNSNSYDSNEDPELSDWTDVTKSPPPYSYLTTASPATSPFKRSSGWPAWGGDESLPPGPSSEPECNSPEPTKPIHQRSRSRSKTEFLSSSSRSNSAASLHVQRLSQSRSRSPSVSRVNSSQELRRSGAFFEDKAKAQAEAELLAKEAADRLERARKATPPQKLLEREAQAQQRKCQQLKEMEQEIRTREKLAKARDVPVSTYLSVADAEEAEQKRKERIRQRADKLMQSAELPPRMAGAEDTPGDEAAMTVKMKKKLRASAEEEARRAKPKPKPVPNFDQLHSKWEAALKTRKELARRNQDEEARNDIESSSKKSAEFFTSRAAKLAELQEKKEERKQRLKAKEEAIRQHAQRAQEKLLARTRVSIGKDVSSQRKPTKSEALRVQKLKNETVKQQKERLREEREAAARERRQEEAARRVRAQVKRSESFRRENFAGNFVDLKDLDAVAKEKAREQRQQFKEAIARNKEKLLAAAAARPSLMERFTTGVKRDAHRRAALEAVVKTVFQKDLSTLKDVLTDDEQELAREMVAADDEEDQTSEQ